MNLRRSISVLIRSSARLNLTYVIHNYVTNLKLRSFLDYLLVPLGLLKLVYLIVWPTAKEGFKYQLSIVCIVKNEAPYMREWIKYHLSAGVEHIYIYDNDSTDDLLRVLKEFDNSVTYTKINGNLRQLDAYNDALNKYRNETRLLAVIDADEFLYSPRVGHRILPELERCFKNPRVGGVVVNWVIYGSSYFTEKPAGLVTDNFVYRSHIDFEKNRYIKTICNPRKVFDFTVTHAANYFPGYYAVDELLQKVAWTRTDKVSVSHLRLNHYYSKSKTEFLEKRRRGSGDVMALRRMSEFEEHDKNDVFDDSMRVYNSENRLRQ